MSVIATLDRLQRQRTWLATPTAVVKRFTEHNGTRMSAAIAFFAFFSIFPLLLVFVSVLDLALTDRPELRADLVDSAVGRLPLIGQQIDAPNSAASGSITTVFVGIAGALWAGLGAMAALSSAFGTIWDVRPSQRPNFVRKRVQGLFAVVSIAVLVAASTVIGNVAAILGVTVATIGIGLLSNLGLNVGGLLLVFHFLSPNTDPWRVHVPGAVVGGTAIFVLQQVGGAIARRYVANASDTYGTLAVVIGLLVWLHFVTRVIVLAAETNAVLAHDLSPRSVDGDVVTQGDRRAMLHNTERVLHDEQLSPVVKVPSDSVAGET